jgi:oligoendopeptidase F
MTSLQTNLDIDLCQLTGSACLKFTFKDKLSEEDAKHAVNEWKDLLASSKEDKVNMVWDCLHMDNYENKALSIWQQALKESKERINKIWLVTDSKMLKAGAMLISAFTNLKIKVVKSHDKIDLQ